MTFSQRIKLLTTYGNEDAPNFIDDSTTDSSSNTRRRKPRRPTKFDTELARVIREDTDDGRSIARFLIDVMVGEFKSFRPHHRMAAARELLDRGFGKSARNEKVSPSVRPEPHRRLNPGSVRPVEVSVPVPEPFILSQSKYPDYPPMTPTKSRVIPGSQKSQFRQPTEEHTLTPQNTHPPVVPARPEPRGDTGYDFMGSASTRTSPSPLTPSTTTTSSHSTDWLYPECEVHGDPTTS